MIDDTVNHQSISLHTYHVQQLRNVFNSGYGAPSSTTTSSDESKDGGDEDDLVPGVRALILVGFLLLFVNVCACAGVVFQKYRVRQRENRLRTQITALSDILAVTEPQLANRVSGVAETMRHVSENALY